MTFARSTVFLLSFGLATVSACSSTNETNARDTSDASSSGGPLGDGCEGCFLHGECRTGREPQACGEQGTVCRACADGESCAEGQCVAARQCSSETCDGCCIDDVCQAGTSAGQCGRGGAFCQACAEGSTCTDGECAPGCGPGNCLGCCDDSGRCVERGAQNEARCGNQGEACASCAAEEICGSVFVPRDEDGALVETGACKPQACTNCEGCCVTAIGGGAECASGTEMLFCGQDGLTCKSCTTSESCRDQSCLPLDGTRIQLLLLRVTVPATDANGDPWDYLSPPDIAVRGTVLTTPPRQSNWIAGPPNSTTVDFDQFPLISGTYAELKNGVTFEVVDEDSPDPDDLIFTTGEYPIYPSDQSLASPRRVLNRQGTSILFEWVW